MTATTHTPTPTGRAIAIDTRMDFAQSQAVMDLEDAKDATIAELVAALRNLSYRVGQGHPQGAAGLRKCDEQNHAVALLAALAKVQS